MKSWNYNEESTNNLYFILTGFSLPDETDFLDDILSSDNVYSKIVNKSHLTVERMSRYFGDGYVKSSATP